MSNLIKELCEKYNIPELNLEAKNIIAYGCHVTIMTANDDNELVVEDITKEYMQLLANSDYI